MGLRAARGRAHMGGWSIYAREQTVNEARHRFLLKGLGFPEKGRRAGARTGEHLAPVHNWGVQGRYWP